MLVYQRVAQKIWKKYLMGFIFDSSTIGDGSTWIILDQVSDIEGAIKEWKKGGEPWMALGWIFQFDELMSCWSHVPSGYLT